MTEPSVDPKSVEPDNDEISLFAVGSVLLRWRQTIIALGVCGLLLGLAFGLLRDRVYASGATFIPQGSEGGASGLALAASQLGIQMPASSGATWGPPLYVELLGSQALLEPIALDTVVVAEEGGRRIALVDLLKVKAITPAKRVDLAVKTLRRIINVSEDKRLGAVRLSVSTKWPSVSLALAEKLVRSVNQFNLEKRQSQAMAERLFVEAQAKEAEHALRESEDQLQLFLQRNRSITGSPDLEFQRDRLRRELALRQQVYTSLVQNREDARIREVRDTPVITVLESPRLPVMGEARKSIQKALLGGLGGGMFGVLIAFIVRVVASARKESSEEAQQFFQLVEEAKPRFLRREADAHPGR